MSKPTALAMSGGSFTSTHHSTSYPKISPLNLDLTGKHVLITGCASPQGVGYATATAFARAGASLIIVVDLHVISDSLISQLKTAATSANRAEPVILSHTVDISDPNSVAALQASISDSLAGSLDILINNAAHMEPMLPFLAQDPDTYWRTWEVNLRGLFNMSRAFLPLLLSSPPGSLKTMINLSSSGALSVRPNSSAYRSSKLAILRWTESIALEYAEQGLVTYCVNPGSIKTEMSRNVLPEQVRDRLVDEPGVAGDTICWLGSERREWLGGRYVSCVWDMEELEGKRGEVVERDLLKMRMVF